MSEQPGTYLGETPEDQTYQIKDEASPRDYYAQIPNIVDLMELSPHAYRLYGHLRRVAGETGKCWQSTSTLSKSCCMSGGMVSSSKQELENVYPPLIRIESKKFDRGAYHEITITDIWDINHAFYTGGDVVIKTATGGAFHNMNEWRSQYELDRSQYETKNNPIKKNPLIKGSEDKTTAPPKLDMTDKRFAVISQQLAELQGGGLNGGSADLISTWLDIHTMEWILKAIRITAGKGIHTQAYVDGVLKGWERDGYPKPRTKKVVEVKMPPVPTYRPENVDYSQAVPNPNKVRPNFGATK